MIRLEGNNRHSTHSKIELVCFCIVLVLMEYICGWKSREDEKLPSDLERPNYGYILIPSCSIVTELLHSPLLDNCDG